MFRYTVRYRRNDSATREYRITVSAANAEDARRAVVIRDPAFLSTIETPRRMGAARRAVVIRDPAFLSTIETPRRMGAVIDRCRICGGELDQDFTFLTDGGAACWRCREKADLPEDQYVTVDGGRFGDIEVEWT